MMNVNVDDDSLDIAKANELRVEGVLEAMWKFNQNYKISTERLVTFYLQNKYFKRN